MTGYDLTFRERDKLISQLRARYPYSYNFFDKLSDDQLIAMHLKPYKNTERIKKKKKSKNVYSSSESKRKKLDGISYILTDGGFWEEEEWYGF